MSWYNIYTMAARYWSAVKKSAPNASYLTTEKKAATYLNIIPENEEMDKEKADRQEETEEILNK